MYCCQSCAPRWGDILDCPLSLGLSKVSNENSDKGRHVLIEAQNSVGITLNDKPREVINLILTPQHGDGIEAEALG